MGMCYTSRKDASYTGILDLTQALKAKQRNNLAGAGLWDLLLNFEHSNA